MMTNWSADRRSDPRIWVRIPVPPLFGKHYFRDIKFRNTVLYSTSYEFWGQLPHIKFSVNWPENVSFFGHEVKGAIPPTYTSLSFPKGCKPSRCVIYRHGRFATFRVFENNVFSRVSVKLLQHFAILNATFTMSERGDIYD